MDPGDMQHGATMQPVGCRVPAPHRPRLRARRSHVAMIETTSAGHAAISSLVRRSSRLSTRRRRLRSGSLFPSFRRQLATLYVSIARSIDYRAVLEAGLHRCRSCSPQRDHATPAYRHDQPCVSTLVVLESRERRASLYIPQTSFPASCQIPAYPTSKSQVDAVGETVLVLSRQ
jgi:hypothetical protein